MAIGERLRILVVGQTPPPFGGQAVMVENLLRGDYEGLEMYGVRMAFSREMDEIGRFRVSKLFHLVWLIVRIAYGRIRYRTPCLYYPPAGPERVPFYRDVAILLATRWMFRWTAFHFQGSGISELYGELSVIERFLYRLAYFYPDVAIRLSELSPPDDSFLRAKRSAVVPNGIPDAFSLHFGDAWSVGEDDPNHGELGSQDSLSVRTPRILFVGVLRESKGFLVLLDACRLLDLHGVDFEVELVGRFQSIEVERRARESIAGALDRRVRFPGVLTGRQKWEAYARADLFCFPSFFESETLPLVVIEAMQFSLPVVATHWRGIPSIVEEGETGLLVPVRDPDALADVLEGLLIDPDLRAEMGARGRRRYEEMFTEDRWYKEMERAFLSVYSEQQPVSGQTS